MREVEVHVEGEDAHEGEGHVAGVPGAELARGDPLADDLRDDVQQLCMKGLEVERRDSLSRPPEDRVDHPDPRLLRLEEPVDPEEEPLEALPGRPAHDPARGNPLVVVLHEVVENREVDPFLAVEVVVEGRLRDSGHFDDLPDRSCRIAPVRKEEHS